MMFRDLKCGDTLYIYDRSSITLTSDKIVNVSAPHPDKTNIANGCVVDVSIASMVYSFKDNADTGYTANLVISPDKQNILREVEAQKMSNESQLARIDTLKEELPKLSSIIDKLNPEIKEKRMQKEEIASMKSDIKDLKEMVELLINSKK